MSLRFVKMAFGATVLAFLGATASPCASSYIQSFERSANSVTLYSKSGALRIEVCSDRIIHVVASPTRKIPAAIVPAVIGQCNDSDFRVVSSESMVAIHTPALQVSVDRATGTLRFFS
ncbi:MAG TPA: hypothetical protein VN776_16540, partial [Terracidiphilus sp.]|nr:hypothetical protein [Terracidiphilus sp.]